MGDKGIDYKKQGKANRAKGARFELKVRKYLEEQGWIVSKWQNNVDLEENRIVVAKGNRFRMTTTGFPDFVAFMNKNGSSSNNEYKLILIECKFGKYLNKIEKEKMAFLTAEGIECWVAYNDQKEIAFRKFVDGSRSCEVRREQVRYRIR